MKTAIQMLASFTELTKHINKILNALEAYEPIPGITESDIETLEQCLEECKSLVNQHAKHMTSGLWIIIGNHRDTGEWEIVAGPYDAQAFCNSKYYDPNKIDVDSIPLTENREFPYNEVMRFKSLPLPCTDDEDEEEEITSCD